MLYSLYVIWYRFIDNKGEEVEGKLETFSDNKQHAVSDTQEMSKLAGINIQIIKSLYCGQPTINSRWN